jgi:hypothetical protein
MIRGFFSVPVGLVSYQGLWTSTENFLNGSAYNNWQNILSESLDFWTSLYETNLTKDDGKKDNVV